MLTWFQCSFAERPTWISLEMYSLATMHNDWLNCTILVVIYVLILARPHTSKAVLLYWLCFFSAAQPFFFAAPGGPKLARPLASACKQWLWPFFFLGPDLLDQDHLLRHETGPGHWKRTHPLRNTCVGTTPASCIPGVAVLAVLAVLARVV